MFFLKELPTRQILERYNKRFPEMNVDAVEGALSLMHTASRLIRDIDSYFAAEEFSQLRFLICIVIEREEKTDGLTPSEIAKRIDVSKPVMTRTLKTLVEAGQAVFLEHGTDRRSKVVTLTDKGRQKLASILPGYYAVLESFMTRQGDVHG